MLSPEAIAATLVLPWVLHSRVGIFGCTVNDTERLSPTAAANADNALCFALRAHLCACGVQPEGAARIANAIVSAKGHRDGTVSVLVAGYPLGPLKSWAAALRRADKMCKFVAAEIEAATRKD